MSAFASSIPSGRVTGTGLRFWMKSEPSAFPSSLRTIKGEFYKKRLGSTVLWHLFSSKSSRLKPFRLAETQTFLISNGEKSTFSGEHKPILLVM
jgi:hypothetical protein